ncbi:helix-turn-helix domain-containing protein [Noviherbaspirillum saxi]|uniref:Helix-turn-helix domain-containing protein n=1 Tax=Noviherbaspirillum saxi TaxID=2320863 RepID=A0A3A3FG48_9BURK|nr:helix-turn-helix domain-containing protein [Noviherbaspirillum saxi]
MRLTMPVAQEESEIVLRASAGKPGYPMTHDINISIRPDHTGIAARAVQHHHELRVATASDADDHARNLSRWNQEYDQFSAGVFSGKITELWLTKTQLFLESTNQVSRRTLQYCFEEVVGMSPLNFLRTVRLNAVRRELFFKCQLGQVTEVAMSWGFRHLSQFASDFIARLTACDFFWCHWHGCTCAGARLP